MCGRTACALDPALVRQQVSSLDQQAEQTAVLETVQGNYNVAPTTLQPVIVFDAEQGMTRIRLMRWGLQTSWSTAAAGSAGAVKAYNMINARSETVQERPAFRSLLARRRCVIVANGFYEWFADRSVGKRVGSNNRKPYFVRFPDNRYLTMAGLYNEARPSDDPATPAVPSFTILTTAAAPKLSWLHDRMPVILAGADVDAWLDVSRVSEQDAVRLMRPYTAELTWYPVAPLVSRLSNRGIDCIQPTGPANVRPARTASIKSMFARQQSASPMKRERRDETCSAMKRERGDETTFRERGNETASPGRSDDAITSVHTKRERSDAADARGDERSMPSPKRAKMPDEQGFVKESSVQHLLAMGFSPRSACEQALIQSRGNIEAACDRLLSG